MSKCQIFVSLLAVLPAKSETELWLVGSDRSSRIHNVFLSVCYKVLIRSLNIHISSSDQSAGSEQSVSTQRAPRKQL